MKTGIHTTPSVFYSFIVLACTTLTFLGACKEDMELVEEEVVADTIYITDATLDDVYYHEASFDHPTILVFPNLTTAANSVYFHLCTNIKEVHFPNLISVGELNSGNPYFYFHYNEGLKKIYAPNLATVYGYVYFYGNSTLDLSSGICSIADIYPRGDPDDVACSNAKMDIMGNANNNVCFSATLHVCN